MVKQKQGVTSHPPLASEQEVIQFSRCGFSASQSSGHYLKHLQHALAATQAILARLGLSDVIISSGEMKTYYQDDQTYPFGINPFFRYYCPIDGAYHLIHFSDRKEPHLTIFMPDDFWLVTPNPEDHPRWQDVTSVMTYEFATQQQGRLSRLLTKCSQVGRCIFLGDESDVPEGYECHPPDVIREFGQLRLQKTSWEVLCHVEATKIALQGHKALEQRFLQSEPVSERDLYYEYLQATQQTSEEYPYPPIIALAENGAFLHYNLRGRSKVRSVSFLVDAGASFAGYASDISRTYRGSLHHNNLTDASGQELRTPPVTLFGELLAGLTDIQQTLWPMAVPGQCFIQLHLKSLQMIYELLLTMKLIKGPPLSVVAEDDMKAVTRVFYPHGLGHMLGLQVHDVSFNKESHAAATQKDLRHQNLLDHGHLFTIEPGIYFIPSLVNQYVKKKLSPDQPTIALSLVESLYPFGGIRVEDNIYLTREGIPLNVTRLVEKHLQNL
ncbi:MAG: M24 family metallopeptidase [Proteobacteria bacterium]|nr:M24 family metallopeptidase [Pseudomonadota bacterium]